MKAAGRSLKLLMNVRKKFGRFSGKNNVSAKVAYTKFRKPSINEMLFILLWEFVLR